MMPPLTVGTVDPDCLAPRLDEVAARLRIPRGELSPHADGLLARLRRVIAPIYVYTTLPVRFDDGGSVHLGELHLMSRGLSQNLRGCDRAYLLAVTLGIRTDRLLRTLAHTGAADHFVADGLASALAEALADACELAIRKASPDLGFRPRYSPGYGDLPLSTQPPILTLLSAEKLLGITLSDSLIMTPMKSVTAVLGAYPLL